MAGHGTAWLVRLGAVWRGMAGCGESRRGMAGKAWFGPDWRGLARRGRQGPVCQGVARYRMARHGTVRLGKAWQVSNDLGIHRWDDHNDLGPDLG
jgi:hypothetical protein